jgi:hypothetical protein
MKTRKPTEICITIDTEFSIGGNFDNPRLSPIAEPIVLGTIDGKEHGLGFLLDSFAEFGARATFFVEALQTAYFGDEPMGTIAKRIAQAGHDVQLHLHPCWVHYEAAAESSPSGRRTIRARVEPTASWNTFSEPVSRHFPVGGSPPRSPSGPEILKSI